LTTVRADVLRGTYIAPEEGRITFGEYAEQWARIQQHRPSTVDSVERHLRRHVLPVLGGRPLGAVRASEVQAFMRGLSDRLAPTTTAVVYSRGRPSSLRRYGTGASRRHFASASRCPGARASR
jgi:hypothetical protein